MEEESFGDIYETRIQSKSAKEDIAEVDDEIAEEEVKVVTSEKEEQEDESRDEVLQTAQRLIDTFAKKLGPTFALDKSVAHTLLKDIKKSTSGSEAIQKLDELIAILEEMLAEVNIVSIVGRYRNNREVSVAKAEEKTITVFDSDSEPLKDNEIHTIEVESSRVKQELIDYTTQKHPELVTPFPLQK